MATIDLGKITFAFKDAYDSGKEYEPLDLVGFEGSTYICKTPVRAFSPSNSGYWDLFVQGLPRFAEAGELLTHDGNKICKLSAGKDGDFLKSFDGKIEWAKQSVRAGKLVEQLAQGTVSDRGPVSAFLMNDGSIRACGIGSNMANGSAASGQRNLPQTVAIDPTNPPKTQFVRLYAGHYCFFALTLDGEVYSWGYNTQGQLGHGDVLNRPIATRINWFIDNEIRIKKIFLPTSQRWGEGSAYFLSDDNRLYACGYNAAGQLGNGTTTNSNIPVRCGELKNIIEVSVSGGHYTSAYAIDTEGKVYAWGYNNKGQLGMGNTTQLTTPTLIEGLTDIVKIVSITGDSTADGANPATYALALDKNGNAFGCGYNALGQLGVGDTTQRNVFTPLSGGFTNIKDIAATDGDYGHSALIDESDTLWLWGYNSYGQLGMADTLNRSAPNKPEGEFQGNVARVLLGGAYTYNFSFVLTKDGELWACGYGDHGQLGVSFTHPAVNNTFQKCRLPFNEKVIDVCFGGYNSETLVFALLESGRVVGAGSNGYGQLGVHPTNLANPTIFEVVNF